MGTPSTDRKAQLDYGVQIRFIKDLHDTGGVPLEKSRANSNATPPSNKYGVAVRVQGISGQPYVVLKDGEKGDSYGVQLSNPNPTSGPTSPYNSIPNHSKEPADFPNSSSPVVNSSRSPVKLTGLITRNSPPKPTPEPPPPTESEPAAAIDTNSLAPINKLINKFNSSTPGGTLQARGRTGARQRLQFDERKRSRSLDARKDAQPEAIPASPSSPALNPHAAPISAASSPQSKNIFDSQFSGRSSLCFLSSSSETEASFKRKSSLVFETPDRLQVKSRFVVPENILQILHVFLCTYATYVLLVIRTKIATYKPRRLHFGEKKKCDCLPHHDVKSKT
uniref:Uncharacterized protein n=1 Tax=Xiphophorus couchianus TaxID=32473 RepID=A0A3B5MQ68_9TELE